MLVLTATQKTKELITAPCFPLLGNYMFSRAATENQLIFFTILLQFCVSTRLQQLKKVLAEAPSKAQQQMSQNKTTSTNQVWKPESNLNQSWYKVYQLMESGSLSTENKIIFKLKVVSKHQPLKQADKSSDE